MLLLNLIQVTESISGSVVPLAMFGYNIPIPDLVWQIIHIKHVHIHIHSPLHDDEEAFLTLVGVLEHIADVDNVDASEQVNCSF